MLVHFNSKIECLGDFDISQFSTAEIKKEPQFFSADLEFLKNLVKEDKGGMLRSGTLAILLNAYQNMDNTFVAELPLELALIKILSEEK